MRLIQERVMSAFASESIKNTAIKVATYSPRFVKKAAVGLYVARQRKALMQMTNPSIMFYFVTNRCNLRCSHCFYSSELSKSYQEMELREIEKVACSLKGTNPSILFCGGEPFMRSDLEDIVLSFGELAGLKELGITTNGFFLEMMVETVEAVMRRTNSNIRIAVSLDGLPEVHNRIRNNDRAFDKAELAISTLEQMSENNKRLKIIINSVISIDNIDTFAEFYRYVRSRHKCDFAFTFLRQDAKDVFNLDRSLLWDQQGKTDLLPDMRRCKELMEEIREIEPYSYLIRWRLKSCEYHLRIVETKKLVVRCIAPMSFATLYPDGGVSLCEVARPFANVSDFDYDFLRAWKSDEAEARRRMLSNCYCTYPCALASTMFQDPRPILDVLNEKR